MSLYDKPLLCVPEIFFSHPVKWYRWLTLQFKLCFTSFISSSLEHSFWIQNNMASTFIIIMIWTPFSPYDLHQDTKIRELLCTTFPLKLVGTCCNTPTLCVASAPPPPPMTRRTPANSHSLLCSCFTLYLHWRLEPEPFALEHNFTVYFVTNELELILKYLQPKKNVNIKLLGL
jgi:hypothetical protein